MKIVRFFANHFSSLSRHFWILTSKNLISQWYIFHLFVNFTFEKGVSSVIDKMWTKTVQRQSSVTFSKRLLDIHTWIVTCVLFVSLFERVWSSCTWVYFLAPKLSLRGYSQERIRCLSDAIIIDPLTANHRTCIMKCNEINLE